MNRFHGDSKVRPVEDAARSDAVESPAATAPVVPVDGGGLRYDSGKPMFELIPPEAIEALARYFTQAGGPPGGPAKYPLRNWERGMLWTRCFGALMRHAWEWMRGEDLDAETGAHHMIAVMWNAAVLYTYAARNTGTDDRPRYKPPE